MCGSAMGCSGLDSIESLSDCASVLSAESDCPLGSEGRSSSSLIPLVPTAILRVSQVSEVLFQCSDQTNVNTNQIPLGSVCGRG